MDREVIKNALFAKGLCVPKNFIAEVSKYLSLPQVLDVIDNYTGQSIISVRAVLRGQAGNIDIPNNFDITRIPSVEGRGKVYPKVPYHLVYTEEEKDYFHSVLTEISRPTTYLTPKGEITVDFDIELFYYIQEKSRLG